MNKFKKNGSSEPQELQVGAGLLNPVSRGAGVPGVEQVNIDMDLIVPNSMNDYSMDELDELAELIIMANGIWQPLILKPDRNPDGTYTLTTGERRWRAAKIARDKGKYPKELNNTVPCMFKDPKDIELPLDDETKELFSIMVTNQYRHKKEADQITEVRNWMRIFEELRANKEEYIPEALASLAGRARYDEEGKYIPERLTGQKTRELVANYANTAEGKVQQIHKLEKEASENLMDKLMKNEISFSAAEKVISLPEEAQEELLQDTEGIRVEVDAVDKHIEKVEKKILLGVEKFSEDIDTIKGILPEAGIELSSKDFKKYMNCLKQLAKILG